MNAEVLAIRRLGLRRDIWGLAVSLSKNDRIDLLVALVGDTPLEYQHTSVAFLLAHSSSIDSGPPDVLFERGWPCQS